MCKRGGTPSRRDKHVTLAAISPPGVARGRFVGGQQSGLAECKPPPLFTRGASSSSSQGRRQGEPWGASQPPSAPTLPFNHDHRTCPIHQADMEAYKKAHGSKKHAPAGIREAKVEVDKDELSKLILVGTELAKEIQEIKRNWVPRSYDKNKENDKDKDKKGRKRGKKKGVNEVDGEESTPTTTTDAP